jgi:hypothetical protein
MELHNIINITYATLFVSAFSATNMRNHDNGTYIDHHRLKKEHFHVKHLIISSTYCKKIVDKFHITCDILDLVGNNDEDINIFLTAFRKTRLDKFVIGDALGKYTADYTKFDELHVPHDLLPDNIDPDKTIVYINDVINITNPEYRYDISGISACQKVYGNYKIYLRYVCNPSRLLLFPESTDVVISGDHRHWHYSAQLKNCSNITHLRITNLTIINESKLINDLPRLVSFSHT